MLKRPRPTDARRPRSGTGGFALLATSGITRILWLVFLALGWGAASAAAQEERPAAPPAIPTAPGGEQAAPALDSGLPWLSDVLAPTAPWYRQVAVLGSVLLVALIAGRLVRGVLAGVQMLLERRGRRVAASIAQALARSADFTLLAVGLSVCLNLVVQYGIAPGLDPAIRGAVLAVALAYVAWRLVDAIDAWLRHMANRTASKLDDMLAPLVRKSIRGTVLVLAVVQVLTILSDKPLTSVLAGLGVGGIAVGLAAQDTIKNFFGSLMIFGDRPFELGDRIEVAGYAGVVETVGFRSTRLRTDDGDLVTIPNGDLAGRPILNAGKRSFLRRALALELARDTPPEKIERAVALLRETLVRQEGLDPGRPPQVSFADIQAGKFKLTATWWIRPSAAAHQAAQSERVFLEILRQLQAAGIALSA